MHTSCKENIDQYITIMELLFVCSQPPDIIEQGKWLNILIKETGCGSPVAKQQPGGVASDDEGRARSLQPHSSHLTSSCLCAG